MSITIWSHFRASSVSSQGESLLSFDSCSIVPIYGYNAQLGNYVFVCVSSRWLKWKPADVRGMQLKDDIIISNQSLPLSFSLSQQRGVVIVYSRSHSPEKTQGGGGNFGQCTPLWVCAFVCTQCALQSGADKLVWLARQRQQGKPSWRKTQLLVCYAFQPFTFMSSRSARIFTVTDDVIKGRPLKGTQHKSGEALFFINISPIVLFQHE